MLSTTEIEELLKSIPTGYKRPKDNFFSASNNRHNLLEHKKLGVITNTDDPLFNDDRETTTIHCNIPGCQLIFNSVAAYQTHFNSVHRYLCVECRRSLPTPHLLDLHVSEQHDSYFAARVARGESMFVCFLEECQQKMIDAEERKDHCIKVHKFPGNFRFDQLCGNARKNSKHTKRIAETDAAIMDINIIEGASTRDVGPMDVVDNMKVRHKTLTFSFGHQREKTFQSVKNHNNRKHNGKETLDDLHELRDALDDLE